MTRAVQTYGEHDPASDNDASARLARVTRLLQGWNSRQAATLAERLAYALIDLIDQGELHAGFRMPPERRLAKSLAVSRGIVTAAFSQLKDEAWLDSHAGSGWTVMSVKGRTLADGTRVDGRLATFQESEWTEVDLSSGALSGLALTRDIMVESVRARLPALLDSDGYQPHGLPDLRQQIKSYYDNLGAPVDLEQITVTTGSQQALQLLADAFIAPGDTILVEDPTYRGAIEVFRSRGAKLVPIPVTSNGPDLDILERLVRRLRPRFVYLLPIAHNPTGYIISDSRANAIAEIIDASEAVFIEDGSPADLVLDRERPPTPVGVGLSPDQWVVVGSMSKLFWGGLRVGWIRGPAGFIQRVTRLKTMADLGTSVVSQAIAADCLRVTEKARAVRRHDLLAKLDVATKLMADLAPEWLWDRPQGGSGIWARVPETDTRVLAEAGRQIGVSVVPGAFFSPVDGFADYIRIPFWGDELTLRTGIERLVIAWGNSRATARSLV